MPHLFEFMDQPWLPESLRATLREILELGSSRPFQDYYEWVAGEVREEALSSGCPQVVELGAGTAPVARHLARRTDLNGLTVIICDSHPMESTYRLLHEQHPATVRPVYEPVDFTERRSWPERTLLFVTSAFHHVPPQARAQALKNLTDSGTRVMIFEPLRKSWLSVLLCIASLGSGLILPIWYLGRPGRFRRLFWCWLVPIAPGMFVWESLVSSARMWTQAEWNEHLSPVTGPNRPGSVRHYLLRQRICW